MKFITEKEAKAKGLVQLTHWLFDKDEERTVLQGFYKQVLVNKGRVAEYVRDKLGSRIAVFVNDVSIRY